MKTPIQIAILSACPALLVADPSSAYPDGLFLNKLGTPNWTTYLSAWDAGPNIRTAELTSYNGGLYLFSGRNESTPGAGDGGINIQGNPISFILSNNDSYQADDASLNVWRSSSWGTGQPILNINGLTGETTFTNSNVAINSGSLSVGGSPVVLASTASAIVSGLGYLKSSDLGSALAQTSPPTSANWTAIFVPRGNTTPLPGLSEGGSLALGTSTASGEKSIAVGANSTASGRLATAIGTLSISSGEFSTAIGQNSTASGSYSIASGSNTAASGPYSTARGNAATALGTNATAIGWGASAKARCETSIGNFNIESFPSTPININGLNGLFRVGNGTSATTRSDALTTLWNGQTTLTNKDWKANVAINPTASLIDPPSTTDSGGNALVVDGHTVLNGKVVISVPQGDISMGIYN